MALTKASSFKSIMKLGLRIFPLSQADERVIFVGRSARMSERIMLFMIREFRSSHKNWE